VALPTHCHLTLETWAKAEQRFIILPRQQKKISLQSGGNFADRAQGEMTREQVQVSG